MFTVTPAYETAWWWSGKTASAAGPSPRRASAMWRRNSSVRSTKPPGSPRGLRALRPQPSRGVRPPEASLRRPVVATRAPQAEQGQGAAREPNQGPAPRLVAAPQSREAAHPFATACVRAEQGRALHGRSCEAACSTETRIISSSEPRPRGCCTVCESTGAAAARKGRWPARRRQPQRCRVSLPAACRRKGARQNRRKLQGASPRRQNRRRLQSASPRGQINQNNLPRR